MMIAEAMRELSRAPLLAVPLLRSTFPLAGDIVVRIRSAINRQQAMEVKRGREAWKRNVYVPVGHGRTRWAGW